MPKLAVRLGIAGDRVDADQAIRRLLAGSGLGTNEIEVLTLAFDKGYAFVERC